MKKYFSFEVATVGLALFSMFFGAGNIIFPLAVGQYAQDKNLYALSGLILSAAVLPIAGVIAMLLFDGSVRNFFGRLGKIPGFCLALLTIALLGPLGSTPRCIVLAYTTLHTFLPFLSAPLFCALSCLCIFFFCRSKTHLLTLLGWVLTPFLLLSLGAIIVFGLIAEPHMQETAVSPPALFLHGLKEGYNTMDLLAAFFFSSTLLGLLRKEKKEYLALAFRSSIVGAALLALVYLGFSVVAAYHGSEFAAHGKDGLLCALTMKLAGPYASLLICVAVAAACLTTAIALITAFTDHLHKEVFKEKCSYQGLLIASLSVTFLVSLFKFQGISAFLTPILEICYPGLIVLTLLNILHQLKQFQPVKVLVFTAFVGGALLHFLY